MFMKIVHSFWSKPFLAHSKINDKTFGGWRDIKYHYLSWALSCLSFRKQYRDIELVTDQKGKAILIDMLNLPYTSVRVELNHLDHYPASLWAIGKLYAYSLQDKPFIHADGDVYIWEKFDQQLEQAELLGQHMDSEEGHYHFGMKQLEQAGFVIPEVLISDFGIENRFKATNAGIIGGCNTDFFKEYVEMAFWFIDQNLSRMKPSLLGSNYALLYEQYLFSAMARARKIPVAHYLENEEETMFLSNFMRKYGENKYVHLLGDNKSNFQFCRELEMQLITEYPDHYERIQHCLKDPIHA